MCSITIDYNGAFEPNNVDLKTIKRKRTKCISRKVMVLKPPSSDSHAAEFRNNMWNRAEVAICSWQFKSILHYRSDNPPVIRGLRCPP